MVLISLCTFFVTFEGEENTTNVNNKDSLEHTLPDENIDVEAGKGSNIETTSEQKNDSDAKQDTEMSHVNIERKANEEKGNDSKRSNGNHHVEVILHEGNNNVGNNEGAKKKDNVRRARFSSEVTIQTKAYFQTGTESVIMMVWTFIVFSRGRSMGRTYRRVRCGGPGGDAWGRGSNLIGKNEILSGNRMEIIGKLR